MSYTHFTTKRRTFKHLNAYQCGQIEAMLHLGIPKVKIAKGLGIARSTLYAEIKRDTARQMHSDWTYYDQYFAETGQIVYECHHKNAVKPCIAVLETISQEEAMETFGDSFRENAENSVFDSYPETLVWDGTTHQRVDEEART